MANLKITSLKPSTNDRSLSADDIKSIQKTWESVKQDIKGNGFDLFIKFFTAFPEYQQKFRSFADVPISELRGNSRVSAHANNVLYTLTGVIDSIEDAEVFKEMIEKMAENHFRRKIQIEHFQNLGLVLIDLLLDKLGDQVMNQQTIDAWKKAYLVILDLVGGVLERKEVEKREAKFED